MDFIGNFYYRFSRVERVLKNMSRFDENIVTDLGGQVFQDRVSSS